MSVIDTLVTDRTQADVKARNAKGTYNASDLNRVGDAVHYLAGLFKDLGYSVPVEPKRDWGESNWPTPSIMARYLQDVSTLRGLVEQLETTPAVPSSMEKLTYVSANDIEKILLDVHDAIQRIMDSMFYSAEICSGEV